MPSIWSTVETAPAAQPATIATKAGPASHAAFVEQHIPEARAGHWFYNRFFFATGDLQTVLASRSYEAEYPVWYGRRLFRWPADGAQISVDYAWDIGRGAAPAGWADDAAYVPPGAEDAPPLPKRTRHLRPEEVAKLDDAACERPLFLHVHGLTGGSHENYVRAAICEVARAAPDVECAVITTRGCNRTKITTPQLFNGAWTDDLRQLVQHVVATQPRRPIFLAGYSLGASILANYLGQEGNALPSQVKAAVAVSNPWDLLLCHVSIHQSFIGRHVYQPQMAANLCRVVRNNKRELDESPLFRHQYAQLRGCRSVHEFDNIMTAPLFGFDGWQDYYRTASSVNRLRDVRVPLLILAARDDPICGDLCVPYEEAPKNPYAHIVTTTAGGHLGWFSAGGSRWFATVLAKYVRAFVTDTHLDEPARPPKDWTPRPRWFRDGRFQADGKPL